jgi:hypothetical protein
MPALTLPQVHQGLTFLLSRTCRCDTEEHNLREQWVRLIRNELARFNHYKSRKLLASRRMRRQE